MSIEKRGNGFRVSVMIEGKLYRRVFGTLKEARLFERSPSLPEEKKRKILFKEVLEKYLQDEGKFHRGSKQEILRINRIMKDPISKIPVDQMKASDFDDYYKRRLASNVCEDTVIKDRTHMRSALSYGIRKGLLQRNPMTGAMKLKGGLPRERIASEAEIALLCEEVSWWGTEPPSRTSQRVIAAFLFAVETGMRLGEICAMEPCWIHGKVLSIPAEATKTQRKRDVALSAKAREILFLMLELNFPTVFGLKRDSASCVFREIKNKLGLTEKKDSHGNVIQEALRFHDSRATFCTRAAKVLPPMTLAKQLGHTDLKMTMRYYRETADTIADLLDKKV